MILTFKCIDPDYVRATRTYTVDTTHEITFEDKGGEVDVVEHRGPGEYVIIGHVNQYISVDIRY